MTALPPHVIDMIRRPYPRGCHVLPGSLPVVAFGDPRTAETATLGINPSWAEFADADGRLLTGEDRRLAEAATLGIDDFALLDDTQVQRIAEDCFAYFQRNPYWKWFGPLEKVLDHADAGSYGAGTACHLDLVQWATMPVWSELPTDVRQRLLDDGVPHLRNQLRNDNIRLVLLNGKTVLDHVDAVGLVRLEQVDTMHYSAEKTTKLYRGEAEGVVFLGWSVNIQSGFGANANTFLQQLGRWVAATTTDAPVQVGDVDEVLPNGTHADGLDELTALLERWLAESDEPTIGDVGTFGGRAWLHATVGGQPVVLNADTKRAAIEQFVDHARAGTATLRVVANMKGTINKVVFRPDGTSTPGWYCYIPTPLDAPQEL
ncbi:MAG: hypothetical protein M3467_10505 [Actinomycetota bacterium]|nr:hypothetical protein [Actinomycetota bacterium]